MPTEKKAKIIDELEKVFSRSTVGILTDYKGLKTAAIMELRRKFRESKIEIRVIKNTLARIAAEKAGKGAIGSLLKGQTAAVIGYGDDVAQPPKVLLEYIRATKLALPIKGGFLGSQALSAKDVETLAGLPSREVLISRVMGGMKTPIVTLVICLSAPLSGLARVLQARAQQLESAK